jgi:hypothetical protein
MRVTEGKIPLAIHTDNSAFKVYMADIGLFCQHFNIPRIVIQKDNGDIIPIEVKSSTNVRSKSLSEFVKRYKPSYSVRISTKKNFGLENAIQSVPLYAAFCI